MSKDITTKPDGFDYSVLAPAKAKWLREQTEELDLLMEQTAQGVIGIGESLIGIKDGLAHGEFGIWLKWKFGGRIRGAQKLMALARRFGAEANTPQVAYLPKNSTIAALYELATAEDEVVNEAARQAKSGTRITAAGVKKLKDANRKLKERLATARSQKKGVDGHVQQIHGQLRDACDRVRTLEKELAKLQVAESSDSQDARLAEVRDNLSVTSLMEHWEGASPSARQRFLAAITPADPKERSADGNVVALPFRQA